ncbi:MAG: hypothetical protein ABEH66_06610 [Halobacteriales archaeon]
MSETAALFSHRPGSVRNAAALVFALVATGLAALSSPLALLVCTAGTVGLVVGLTREVPRVAGAGSALLLVGVVVAGGVGAPAELFLPALAAAILAWDLGMAGVAVRRELRGGGVERAEFLHVATATVAGATATAAAHLLYRTLAVGVSLPAVILLLVAAVALGLALRE